MALATFDREAPGKVICEHADRCVGCPLIGLDYPDQLEIKRKHVHSAIARHATLEGLQVESVLPADPITAYRSRAKLIVGWSGGRPTIGLYAADHEVIDIPSCRVLRPQLFALAAGLRQILAKPPSAAGGCLVPEAHGGRLSAFDLREAIDEHPGILVTVVLRAGPSAPGSGELAAMVSTLRSLPYAIVGIAINYRRPSSPQVLGPETQALWGKTHVIDRAGSSYQLATFGSFAQAHRGQAQKIGHLVAARFDRLGLGRELRLLDLYGGSGAASLSFAQRGAQVTLVESFSPAADSARRTAEELGLGNVAIKVGDAAQVLRTLEGGFDAVIANPPRRGMAPAVRKAIAVLAPRVVAYVSCDPDTLARDLVHFAELGYPTERVQPVDMIPLTDQVETVAFLQRGDPPASRTLYEDNDLRVLEKPPHFTPRSVGQSERLVWSSGESTSGLAVWAKRPDALAHVKESLRAQVHLVLAKGVTHKKGKLGAQASYVRLNPDKGHSLLKVTVQRGASQAIVMRQLARIGHPVVGDPRYGHAPTNRHFEEKYALDRPFLHTARIELDSGTTPIGVDSPLPGDLALVLARLGHLASMSRNEW